MASRAVKICFPFFFPFFFFGGGGGELMVEIYSKSLVRAIGKVLFMKFS